MKVIIPQESWVNGKYQEAKTIENRLDPLEIVINKRVRGDNVYFISALLWPEIINSLSTSENGEQVEAVFKRNGVIDILERIELLRKSMFVTNSLHIDDYYLDGKHNNELTAFLSGEYSDERAIFLDGKWRS